MMAEMYVRQLLSGRDFGRSNRQAAQMQNFCYLVGDREAKVCALIDPAWEPAELLQIAKDEGFQVVALIGTHCHPDHIGGRFVGLNIPGVAELYQIQEIPLYLHELDILPAVEVSGIPASKMVPVSDKDTISVGSLRLQVIHTPGHSPGSMCLLGGGFLFSGDTLFVHGTGRVDLPWSSPNEMRKTLSERLSIVPEDTILQPGHAYGGERIRIGDLRRLNRTLGAYMACGQ